MPEGDKKTAQKGLTILLIFFKYIHISLEYERVWFELLMQNYFSMSGSLLALHNKSLNCVICRQKANEDNYFMSECWRDNCIAW